MNAMPYGIENNPAPLDEVNPIVGGMKFILIPDISAESDYMQIHCKLIVEVAGWAKARYELHDSTYQIDTIEQDLDATVDCFYRIYTALDKYLAPLMDATITESVEEIRSSVCYDPRPLYLTEVRALYAHWDTTDWPDPPSSYNA